MSGLHVDRAPEGHQRRDRAHQQAARAHQRERLRERVERLVEVLDHVEETDDIQRFHMERGDPLPEVVQDERGARGAAGGLEQQGEVPVDAGDLVAGAGEVGGDAAGAAAQVEQAARGRGAEGGQAVGDQGVA